LAPETHRSPRPRWVLRFRPSHRDGDPVRANPACKSGGTARSRWATPAVPSRCHYGVRASPSENASIYKVIVDRSASPARDPGGPPSGPLERLRPARSDRRLRLRPLRAAARRA